MQLVEIVINCPDRDIATRIAERLVEVRLAACANIGSRIDCIYRWHGAVARAAEMPLRVKTRASHFEAVAAEAAALHPWELPAITAVEFLATPSYRDWVLAETETGGASA